MSDEEYAVPQWILDERAAKARGSLVEALEYWRGIGGSLSSDQKLFLRAHGTKLILDS